MKRRSTLRDALEAWWTQNASMGELEPHLSPSDLYRLLIPSSHAGEKEERLNHLTQCPRCLRELKGIAQSIEEAEAWDLALPKAAASEIDWPKKMPAEGGKYTVVIRRSIADPSRGVITLQVAMNYRETLEGKVVSLRDGRGHVLLKGKITNGEISQEIAALDMVIPRFLIEPE